jgi:voltage-gated potassium channel
MTKAEPQSTRELPPPTRRFTEGRINAFVERHDTAWEIGMAGLAVVYLALSFTIDEGQGAPTLIVGALAAVFLAEFAVRFWDAPSRRRYLRGHWLDLISAFPLVGGLRSVRILRLLRLGAALRIFAIAEHEAELHDRRQSLWFVGPVLALGAIGAAAAYWTIEHGANQHVATFADALYWVFLTTITLGYGTTAPATPEGKLLAGLLIFVGIGLVGFASAQLTGRFLHTQAVDEAAILRKLDDVQGELAALRQELRDAKGP